MNVGVIFGGRSVEHQVSVASARTVANALTDAIYSGPFYTPPKLRAPKTSASLKAVPDGIRVKAAKGRVELKGTGVDDAFIADLKAWLSQRNSL